MNKQKSTKQRMAEWIRHSDCDSCKVCAFFERCNERYATEENYSPTEQECVNGIINYFEGLKYKDEQANQEQGAGS